MLKGVLRAESQEKILIYLLLRGDGYSKAIADFYGVPLTPVQKQLLRLESDGVVVSQQIGKVRNYQLNPRYPFIAPLKELLNMAIEAYPDEVIKSLLIRRTRPRAAGKPTVLSK
ncbi:winged helix-turn-helix domain-containing protein [Saccharospirillum mangrovi]|uniref:winged helix-turn-helix domain-containing protein n=1 Tax=Saccharospirillum mangrovi TaxID=2161747 RepID=UPI0013B3B914|nr:winged helix-turn-helix domain-containing protein [Saccharospirillum mangrovi]